MATNLRDEIIRSLLAGQTALPTSTVGRLSRTALTLARVGRTMMRGRGGGDLDLDSVARLVASFGQLKGLTMKAGQLLSYIDIALPEELREALSTLQTHAQPMPFEVVADVVRQELGERAATLLAAMEKQPVAAASIGQVHRSWLPDGRPVAVKVQYPGIERAIEADFGPASAATRVVSLVYPGARIDDFVGEARRRFLEECDYEHEARAQGRFATLFAEHPVIRVPAPHLEWSTRRVLTTAFVDARGFDAFLGELPSQAARDRLGRAIFEFYVGTLFRHHLYTCDPHPGNYLFAGESADDAVLTVLDYGCTREFQPDFVGRLAALTRAVHRDERDALHGAFVDLGMVRANARYDFDTARRLVRAFFGSMLRDEEQVIDVGEAMTMREVVRAKHELMRLRLPGEFLFLFRIRFGVMSVLARLGARANWYRLERQCLQEAGFNL